MTAEERKYLWNGKVDSLAHRLCYERGNNPNDWEKYRSPAANFLIHQVLKEHYDSNFELPV